MADYISRESAINAAFEGADRWDGGCSAARDLFIMEEINKVPTADAVPVVRCKDCLYYTTGKNICESWEWCEIHQRDTGPYEYCSYGERKDKT